MINIVIKENGAKETLELRMNGLSCVVDVIGNHDGLGTADHQFNYNTELDAYVTTQDNFDWWDRVLADQQALQDRIAELEEIHGSDAVHEAISNSGDCDLEDIAPAINQALDDAFPGK